MLTKIRDHLLCLINNAQHGFIPGRSCTTQLLEILHLIGSLLDSGKQTDVIYIDMSKAFDKVEHATLLRKLEHGFSISGPLLRWFKSYLIFKRIDTASDAALLQQDLGNLEHRSKSSGQGASVSVSQESLVQSKSLTS